MKKALIFSIIFFMICLSINFISKAYSEKFITFEYETKEIVYQDEEKIEKIFKEKVKIEDNAQIKIKDINVKLVEKNSEDYIIEFTGEILENTKIEECKIEKQKYKLNYNEEYSINTGKTFITFKAK